ncbi:hypothetical protein FOXYSP1_00334 [Fusarium oxysporum f. sp. phaseoli]
MLKSPNGFYLAKFFCKGGSYVRGNRLKRLRHGFERTASIKIEMKVLVSENPELRCTDQRPYCEPNGLVHKCSSMLRNPKVTLEIDLDEGAWSQVPQHHRPLLMAMVEFSITGVQLEKDLEDQRERLTNKEERYLLRHGYQQTTAMDGQPLLSRMERLEGRYGKDEQCPLELKISQKTINPKEDEIQVLLLVEGRNCC